MIQNKELKNCRIFYDVDRNEFSFWRFMFLFKQSEYHINLYNVLFFLTAIVFMIMLAESFKDFYKFLWVILLPVTTLLIIKLERWLMYYEIDENLMKISKKMNLLGHDFTLFEEDLSNIGSFFKLKYEMVNFVTFKNSNKKAFFQYTKKNPRPDVIKYFTENLHLEFKEVAKR